MDFAVWHKGLEEGKGCWVLAIDAPGNRFLLSDEDKGFYWKQISACKLLKVATPENPRPVIPIQPQQGIALPTGNGLRNLN